MKKSPKMTIVIRKDLNMRKGKMCSMASHSSLKVFLDKIDEYKPVAYEEGGAFITYHDATIKKIDDDTMEWMQGDFTKVVLGCDSLDDILALEIKAKTLKIPYAIITDNGTTEFGGVKTITCIALGPTKAEI